MSNVKEGDLAICVRGINMGAMVEVLRRMPAPENVAGLCWECRAMSTVKSHALWRADGRVEYIFPPSVHRPGAIIGAQDAYLRPLRDDDIEETETIPLEEGVT